MSESKLRVSAVYTYPIKSIRGCTLPSLKATTMGFEYDRRFMLIRSSDRKNMHVSHYPEMCLFTTELESTSTSSASPVSKSSSSLSSSSSATSTTVTSNAEHEPDIVIVRWGKDHVFNQPDQRIETAPLRIPVTPDVKALGLAQVKIDMHKSPTTGYDMGDDYNSWFSRRLGYDVQLLYIAENKRMVLGNVTPNHPANSTTGPASPPSSTTIIGGGGGWLGSISSMVSNMVTSTTSTISSNTTLESNIDIYRGVDDGIGFADCAPFLIVNTRSWENVCRRLPDGQKMDISKFRPNIVVEGADDEFEEDYWAELHVGSTTTKSDAGGGDGGGGGARLVLTANCARCNSLNVDYDTGKVGTNEAGSILKKLQRDRRVDPGMKYSPVFGRYGFLAQRGSNTPNHVQINVGDNVTIIKRNVQRTRFQWPSLSTDK